MQPAGQSSKWSAFVIGFVIAVLISGIGLATAITMWQTSNSSSTTSSTTQTTMTSTSTTTTTTMVTCTLTTTANTLMYSQNFSNAVTPTAQCALWTSFVAQLTVRAYTSLILCGTFDPIGVSTTDSNVIGNISMALRTSTVYGPVTSNSGSWTVGACGSGYELSASGSTCQCTSLGYTLRPCINNLNYGGINGTTCSAPTQTITVIFRY